MLKKEHIRQASSEKVYKFTREMFEQAIKTIDESKGYLNDTEQVMCVVLLGEVLFGTCRETIGEESVELILEHLANVKEKNNERNENN